jgi:hypothetical protein
MIVLDQSDQMIEEKGALRPAQAADPNRHRGARDEIEIARSQTLS